MVQTVRKVSFHNSNQRKTKFVTRLETAVDADKLNANKPPPDSQVMLATQYRGAGQYEILLEYEPHGSPESPDPEPDPDPPDDPCFTA